MNTEIIQNLENLNKKLEEQRSSFMAEVASKSDKMSDLEKRDFYILTLEKYIGSLKYDSQIKDQTIDFLMKKLNEKDSNV